MRKHRNIDRDAIANLVSENVLAGQVFEQINVFYKELDQIIAPYTVRGKKFKGEDIKVLFSKCCDHFENKMPIVDKDTKYREPTKTRPKGEAYQARYVGFKQIKSNDAGTEQYQLFNFTIFASRKTIQLTFQEQPFTFQYHTAERLLERAESKRDALRRLAEAMYTWSTAILSSKNHSCASIERKLAYPMPDGSGLLLGDFLDRDIYTGKTRTYDHSGCFERGMTVGSYNFMFLARTFVGNSLLSERQTRLAEQLLSWLEKHRSHNHDINRKLFWRSDMLEHTVDRVPLSEDAFDDLADIMDSKEIIDTIINRKNA